MLSTTATAALVATAAAERHAWAASRWLESFYGTELDFAADGGSGDADAAAAAATASGSRNGVGSTGSSKAASVVDVRGVYGRPRGSIRGAYRGSLCGAAIGRELRGTWEEAADQSEAADCVSGAVSLQMSTDGLSFVGEARVDDETAADEAVAREEAELKELEEEQAMPPL